VEKPEERDEVGQRPHRAIVESGDRKTGSIRRNELVISGQVASDSVNSCVNYLRYAYFTYIAVESEKPLGHHEKYTNIIYII
jgi:hypothetical protein